MTIANARRLLVDGRRIEEKETMTVIDKYTGETISSVPVALRFAVEEMTSIRMVGRKP